MSEIRIVPVVENWTEWLTFFANRNDVAEEYAKALLRFGPTWVEWKPLNEAILARWSMAGLRYIKERAWKIAERSSGGGEGKTDT